MLHIILGILKILGILLGSILLLVLLILLTLLFVPVRYQGQAEMDKGIAAKGKITWLFHLLHISLEYRDKALRYKVCVLGHCFLGSDKVEKPRKKRKQNKEKEIFPNDKVLGEEPEEVMEEPIEEPPDISEEKPIGERQEPSVEKSCEILLEQKEPGPKEPGGEPAKSPPIRKKGMNPFERLSDIVKGIRTKWRRFLASLKNIQKTLEGLKKNLNRYLDFWHLESTRESYRHAKQKFFFLLRHIGPRKLEGQMVFGTEDPAMTGQILGALCVLSSFTGGRLIVDADFEKPILAGSVFLKGHIRACHFLRAAIGLVLDKNIRVTVRNFQRLSR